MEARTEKSCGALQEAIHIGLELAVELLDSVKAKNGGKHFREHKVGG